VLIAELKTEIPLAEPDADSGLVTWLDIAIRQGDPDADVRVGSARLAIIQAAEAVDRGISLVDVLDADSDDLLSLHDVFFDDHGLKEDFTNGTGLNALYVSSIELMLPWRGRKIEEALVRRVSDLWGQGCAIAIMPLTNPDESRRWLDLGFVVARKPTRDQIGYAYLDLSLAAPEVVVADDDGDRFEIAPRDGG
jgi:hypothetical protein